jgi:Beta-galactosidase, domain 2
VTRHNDYTSTDISYYTLKLPTSAGQLSIPQLGGQLTLSGRDSKVHVTDYPMGDYKLLYSTAEVFTWKTFSDKTVLILYGGSNEMHEVSIIGAANMTIREGEALSMHKTPGGITFQWETSPDRQVMQYGNLFIYLLGKRTLLQTYNTLSNLTL